ncbi:MAG: hypothetical protein K9J30_02610 [Bacteroidales bacterium]|nr:hypothetical protein [Bacteroidales bacterium]
MKKIMHRLFLSCLKATELIEKKMHFQLSTKERVQLKMHKMMCGACSSYEKQSVFLEKGISFSKIPEYSPEELRKLKLVINEKLSEMK